MPRSGTLGNPQPYTPFGVFTGLPFWGGGLTLLAAAPGIGKTSWLLRMLFESASVHFPSAIGRYEHTSEELRYRLFLQMEEMTSGPHTLAPQEMVERSLARASEAVLLYLNSREDTVRAFVAQSLGGCYGARLTGAGFGGCTVNLVEKNKVKKFAIELSQQYESRMEVKPLVYICQVVDGAGIVGIP